MPPGQWPRVKAVLEGALALQGAARDHYVAAACRDDSALRRQVETLLSSHDHAATFLETPPAIDADDPATDDVSGRVIGTYRIERRVGAGGMGVVYRAHDAKLDRPVALKLLSAAVSANPDRLRRFRAEARAASSLNHPHIVIIHDFGDLDGRPFMVTELVEGLTLRQKLEAGAVPIREALDVAIQVSSALAAAHARGIVHRDIKPENIMIRPDGYVKVLDFGLAKLTALDSPADAESMLRTEPGMVMGTPRYMSPEQARGLETDPRTDVWSLGVVLYEMVAGRPPFVGATTADLIAAILNADPAPLDVHARQAPESLARIAAKALKKDPAARYASAADLHSALLAIRTGVESGLDQPATEDAGPWARQHTVGRDKERAELHAAFRRAAGGHGHLLSISGDAGSGKSTLAESFLDGLTTGSTLCRIGRGRCSERLAGSEAYLPILEALESLLHGDAGDVAPVFTEFASAWYSQVASATPAGGVAKATDTQGGSQERLKREIAALTRELSQSQPLVLFFDDVHWADASTIDLLAYLAPRFATLRVLVIVTSRPSDLRLANHPFLSLRQDLQARRLCHELALDMLTADDVERYLALEFPGHRFPPELPRLIHAKTEGSPLFMADLVRYLRTKGTLVQAEGGGWMVQGSLDEIGRELPESVRGMIERKIAQLGDEDRALLTAASVQGYEFDSAVVAQALGQDASRVEERLETLERAHRFVQLVEEREFPDRTLTLRYRFVHVLYQNALYAQLRATRKVALSKAVADALLQFYDNRQREIASQLAPLFETARDYSRAAEFYGLAAQQAAQLFASREAVVLASRGVTLLQSLPDGRERQDRELALLVGLGNALIATQGYSSNAVLETYLRARELCQQLGDTPYLAAVLYGFASSTLTRGDHAASLQYGNELLALTERQGDAAVVVGHRMVGWPLLAMGRLEEARQSFENVRAIYQPKIHRPLAYSHGHEPGMSSQINLALTLWLLGEAGQARLRRDEALDLGRQTPHANSQGYAFHFAAMHDQLQGDREQVQSNAEAALKLAEEQGLALWLGWSAILKGWALAAGGEADAGIAAMRTGIDAARARGAALFHTYYLGLLADTLCRGDRLDEAVATLQEAESLVTANQERFWESELLRLRGEIAAARGQQDDARMFLDRAIDVARGQGAKSLERRAVASLERLQAS